MTIADGYARIGGLPCFDFANTVGPRIARSDTAVHDYLAEFTDLLTWSEHAGTVSGNRARLLQRRSQQHPDAASRAIDRARSLREAIFAVFAAIARGDDPPSHQLADLQAAYTEAMARAELVPTDAGLDWTWAHDRELECLLWPVVRSAVEAVTGADFSRIKQCAGHDGSCGWLFYDTSKNGLRRWCSMQACGTWEKTRGQTHRRPRGRSVQESR